MNMISNKTFVVADDNNIVRNGLSFFIKNTYDSVVVHEAATFLDLIQLVEKEKIDLIVLDINFPDGVSLGIIPTVKKIQPEIKILIFSALEESSQSLPYFEAGANGYLNKAATGSDIEQAIILALKRA